ncbi:MAG TPA: hypothetical protein VJ962_09535 [Clostridia bacterium]|nr:hypothetical protein [Clostridia bacterium]
MFNIEFLQSQSNILSNFLNWAIENLGSLNFIIIIGGIFYFLSIKALLVNLSNKDYERSLLVVILLIIVFGGLVGFALEFK